MKGNVTCSCGHSWSKSDSSKKDANVCHICGKDNTMEDGGWLDKYQEGGSVNERMDNEIVGFLKNLITPEVTRSDAPARITTAPKDQSLNSKMWDVVSHPVTAFKHLVNEGRLPNNFAAASPLGIDTALDITGLNPLGYASLFHDIGASTLNLVTGKGSLGDLITLPVTGLAMLPGAKTARNIVGRHVEANSNFYSPIFNTIEKGANKIGSKVKQVDQKLGEKVFTNKNNLPSVPDIDPSNLESLINYNLKKGLGIKKIDLPMSVTVTKNTSSGNNFNIRNILDGQRTGSVTLEQNLNPFKKQSLSRGVIDAIYPKGNAWANTPGFKKVSDFPFSSIERFDEAITYSGSDYNYNDLINSGVSGELNKAINETLKANNLGNIISGGTGHSTLGKKRWDNLVSKGHAENLGPGKYKLKENGGWLDKYEDGVAKTDATRVAAPALKLTKTQLDKNKAINKQVMVNTEKANAKKLSERKNAMAESNDAGVINPNGKRFAIGDKFRMFPNDVSGYGEAFDDFINPAVFVGNTASGLGNAMIDRDAGAFATEAGMALGAGALGFDPLGSAMKIPGKVAQSMESGVLSNAYKINPFAFKPNESNWYRQVGKSAMDDVLETGLIREVEEEVSPRMWGEFQDQIKRLQGDDALGHEERMMQKILASRRPISPFFAKGELFYPMGRKEIITKSGKISKNSAGRGNADYLIETTLPNESFQPAYVKGMSLGVPDMVGSTAILKPNPSLRDISNFQLYKQDWLQGYKKLPKKENGGWLEKYNDGGPVQPNYNDSSVSAGEGFQGDGYSNVGRNYSPAWGGQFQMGGSMPGAVGFMYARTNDPAPSNGKYAKKTKASAQNGTELKNAYAKWPALRNMGTAAVNKDYGLGLGLGYGGVEFMHPNLEEVNYDNGVLLNQSPGKNSTTYNPLTDDAQSVRLDMLHGMHQDPTFSKHRDAFKQSVLSDPSIKGDMNHWYNEDKKKDRAGDGKDQWMNNYIDGQMRTLLFEGDRKSRNYSDEEANQLLSNPKIKKSFNKLNDYLKTGYSYGQGPRAKNGKKVIKDDRGQWDHPGEITEIGSNQITMQGVPYPVMGVSDTGDMQMMYPDEDYVYDGESVTEYPMMAEGGKVATDTSMPRMVKTNKKSSVINKQEELPLYYGPNVFENCVGAGCSKLATTETANLYGVSYDALSPQDAWYKKAAVLKDKGKEIWDPSKSDYSGVKIGDFVSMDRFGHDHDRDVSPIKGFTLADNEKIEHVGSIIGRNEKGIPLVKHGSEHGKVYVQPITDLVLPDANDINLPLYYKPKSIYRSAAVENLDLKNKKYYTKPGKIDPIVWQNPTETPTKNEKKYLDAINKNAPMQQLVYGLTPDETKRINEVSWGIFHNETKAGATSKPVGGKMIAASLLHAFGRDNAASLGDVQIKYDDLMFNKDGSISKTGRLMQEMGVNRDGLYSPLEHRKDYNDEVNSVAAALATSLDKIKNNPTKYKYNPDKNTVYGNIPVDEALATIYRLGAVGFKESALRKHLSYGKAAATHINRDIEPSKKPVVNVGGQPLFAKLPKKEQGGQLTKLDQLTNFTNYNTKQPGGWLDKYQ